MLLCLYGKTGSGKDHAARIFKRKYDYNHVVRPTTRPIRPGETDGETYDFLDLDEYLLQFKMGDITLHYQFRDWHYGLYLDILDKISSSENYVLTGDKELIVDIYNMAMEHGIEKQVFFAEVIAPREIRLERALRRGATKENIFEVNRRMDSDDLDYANIMFDPDFELGSFGSEEDYNKTIEEIYSDMGGKDKC